MANKNFNTRIINKHDTEENWSKANFIPKQGELIIYDKDSTHDIERFKIGDGTTTVNELPFQNINISNSKRGSAILIDDISPVTHEMGVKVKSKNLIPYPYINTTKEENGITFTDNGDGSITISGKAERDAYFYLCTVDFGSKNMWNESANSNGYYVSGCKHFFYNGNNKISTIIVPSGTDYSTDTITVKPQIEEGTTPTAYTPYVPDLTAVKVNTYGKNFIDINSIANDIVEKNPTSCEITDFDGKRCLKIGTTSTIKYTIQTLIPLYGLQLKVYSTGYSASFMGYTKKDTEASVFYINVSAENEWVNITRYYPGVAQYYTLIQFYKTDATKPIYIDLDSVMLEASHTATEYEAYKGAEYTPSADGTVNGVTSLYPNTTLMTDTGGVLIDCEYNRDINKAFAELQAAIISSGGNV